MTKATTKKATETVTATVEKRGRNAYKPRKTPQQKIEEMDRKIAFHLQNIDRLNRQKDALQKKAQQAQVDDLARFLREQGLTVDDAIARLSSVQAGGELC